MSVEVIEIRTRNKWWDEVQGHAKKLAIRLDYSGASSPDAMIRIKQKPMQFDHGQAFLTGYIHLILSIGFIQLHICNTILEEKNLLLFSYLYFLVSLTLLGERKKSATADSGKMSGTYHSRLRPNNTINS